MDLCALASLIFECNSVFTHKHLNVLLSVCVVGFKSS